MRIVAPLLLACLALSIASGSASAQATAAVFSGSVYHAGAERPVANVRVDFRSEDGRVYTGVSGPEGRYEVAAPPSGPGGYLVEWSGPTILSGRLPARVVGLPRELPPLFVQLPIFPVRPGFLRQGVPLESVQPTFVWRSIPAVSRYRLTVSGSGRVVAEEELSVESEQAEFSLRLGVPLEAGENYAWFVRGLGHSVTRSGESSEPGDVGAFTDPRPFRTARAVERIQPGGGRMRVTCFEADPDLFQVVGSPSPPQDGSAAPPGTAFLPGEVLVPTGPPDAWSRCLGFVALVTLPVSVVGLGAAGLDAQAARLLYFERGRWWVARSQVDSSGSHVSGEAPVAAPVAVGVQTAGRASAPDPRQASWVWLAAAGLAAALLAAASARRS